jgi:hypothetical protein
MQDTHPEPELRNQYIAVLLEFYGTKREMVVQSPMEKAKVKYWQKIVSTFESWTPKKTRNKAKFRAGRAEAKKLIPVQVALVRYAWSAYYEAFEDDQDVLRRWEQYLYGDPPESDGKMTDYEFFRQKRQFKELVGGIKREDLWPWSSQT